MRYDLTKIQVKAIMDNLADAFEDDERLHIDTLEAETDLFEITKRLLDHIEVDEGDKAALAEQMDTRKVRRDRCDARIKARREAIAALMECAGLDKLPLPEATLSLRKVAPKPIVVNVDALPDGFCTFTRKPDMAAIKAVGLPLPDGVALDNGGTSLTIRRK